LTPPNSGSALGGNITFTAYGTGANPIIDATTEADNAVNINAKDYITISNLSLRNGNSATQGVVFIQGGADHVTIQSCDIGPSSQHGVQFQYDAGGYNQILNNTIHGNALNGISSYIHTGSTNDASRTIISGNNVYSNAHDGIHLRSNYWTVESNIVHDNGSEGVYVGIHPYSGEAVENSGDNNIIRYNIVYNQKGNSEDGSGIGIDQWCDSNEVYYNVVYNNDGKCIYAYDAASPTIYNNTCYGNMQDSYTSHSLWAEIHLVGALTDNVLLKNNIAQATKANTYAVYVEGTVYDNTIDITNNIWYAAATNWYFWNDGGGNNLGTWNALTGVGTDINSNPQFISTTNYYLRAGSPAINAGANVSLTSDFSGNGLVGAPDIGAYEYASQRGMVITGGAFQ
jgi:parallel beta-helix repeat protein